MEMYTLKLPVFFILFIHQVWCQSDILTEFVSVDYVWPYEGARDEAIADGSYIPENNVISGIKVWRDEIFLTVPRWLPGVPFTMNKLTYNDAGSPLLEPYPSVDWQGQHVGNCSAFQFTQSMEIDPKTGWMWIIDVGRRNIWAPDDVINLCPPKLLIYDMINEDFIHTHVFPASVLSYTENFLNDIVVDPINGDWAYMSDVGAGPTGHSGGIVVFDYKNDRSWRLEHPSMNHEPDGSVITINGDEFDFPFPIDGIALNPDGKHLFYNAIGAYHLWHLETAVAQDENIKDLDPYVRDLGAKVSQTDGMVMGHKALYFGALGLNAVYAWDYLKDMEDQGTDSIGTTNMTTQTLIKMDNSRMIWPDAFALSEQGILLTTASKIAHFSKRQIDWSGDSGPNFRVVAMDVGDIPYISPPDKKLGKVKTEL